MRHNRQTHRLSRTNTERKALLESLVTSLLKYQQIKTTLPKAKAAQRLADKMITLGKENSLAAKRQAFSYLQNHQLVSKLFNQVAPRFKSRLGGYTRILHLSRRKGDGAELALLEWTEKEIIVKQPKKKSKAKGHDHSHEGHEGHEHGATESTGADQKDQHGKHEEGRKGPQGKGFFKNIGKFFRNKGGG